MNWKIAAWVWIFALLTLPCQAAGGGHFMFRKGAAVPDAIAVPPGAAFAHSRGFGFEPAGAVSEDSAGCLRAADPILLPDRASRFSVALEEGTYKVSLHYAHAPAGAVAVEARRFYYLPGAAGQQRTREVSFVVDVRTAALPPLLANAPGGPAVRLNPRECGSYSWDNKLTVALYGEAQKLESLDVTPVDVPHLFLLGDSTVTDHPQPPYAGWGQMLPLFFGPNIAIANYAESGETLKSFFAELRLDKILSEAKPGDWALIQFSHNDEKQAWLQTYAPAASTFPLYLKIYIAELRRHGVKPVLVTPMERMRFDSDGKIVETHGAYPDAIRAVAASEDVPLVDLNRLSKTLFEAMGPEGAKSAFAGHGTDATHQSTYGAFELARAIVAELDRQNLPLADYLKAGLPPFDPATPDSPQSVTP